MAASRPVGRAAYTVANAFVRSGAGSPVTVPSSNSLAGPRTGLAAWRGRLPTLLPPARLFSTGACGYCSQQFSYATSSTHTCGHMMPTHTTPTHSPAHTPTHMPRRINRRTELDFEELRALQLAGDIALIDVRDANELSHYGEIPGSMNIPLAKIKLALQLSEDEFEREFSMEKPDKEDRNIVFYARGPNASSAAVEIAHRMGFKRSRHYIGGWEDYCKQTGMPLKKHTTDSMGGCSNFHFNKYDQFFL